jgi:DNA-binding NtrC family response regulator
MILESDAFGLDMRRAFVIDDDEHIHEFVELTLAEQGFKTERFKIAKDALAALGHDHPAIIFLDVALLYSDAIDVLIGLGEQKYDGVVHLMSGGRQQLLEAVQRLGVRHGVKLAPPMGKPISRETIIRAIIGMDSLIAAPRPQRAVGKTASPAAKA